MAEPVDNVHLKEDTMGLSTASITESPPDTPTAFAARFVTANLYRVPAWSPRRAGTIRLAQAADAHIWGLQESEEYERDIMPSLGGSWLEASDRSNITIIYRSDLFRRIWHGEYSVPADNRTRHHVMAILQHLITDLQFLVINVHMSNGGEWAAIRTKHAEAIVAQIEAQKRAGRVSDSTPVIVMGDVNDTRKASVPGSPAGVFAAAGLIDITTNKARIDRVFARNAVMSGEVVIIKTIGSPDPSDHNWTQVDLNVGVGTPLPPPPPPKPPIPPTTIVTMWVRPKGDPIYKISADMHPRKPDGITIDESVTRYPGYRVTGVLVTVKGIQFIRVKSGRLYNVAYLTVVKP